MYNPCVHLKSELLEKMISLGEKYFVRQTYERGRNPWNKDTKGYFLFSVYPDIAFAQEHIGAIENDPNRKLYNADDEQDYQNLRIAAGHNTGYECFTNVFRTDYEAGITPQLKKKIRHYVKTVLNWNVSMSEGLGTKIYLEYGHLYIELKYKGRSARVKFEEIENIS